MGDLSFAQNKRFSSFSVCSKKEQNRHQFHIPLTWGVGLMIALFGVLGTINHLSAAVHTPSTPSTPSTAILGPVEETGTISGMVWWDLNGNDVWEFTEIVVVGWPVYLQAEADAPDGPIQQRLTDENGIYIFGDLPYGFYDLWTADHLGDARHQRVEVGEVGAPISHEFGVAGWRLLIPMYYKSDTPPPPFKSEG